MYFKILQFHGQKTYLLQVTFVSKFEIVIQFVTNVSKFEYVLQFFSL